MGKYFSWYHDAGHSELIPRQLNNLFTSWHEKHHKPIIMAEYGAGAISGFHADPAALYTEDYQVEVLHQHFIQFDELRKAGYFIGEMIWNFADFMTKQEAPRAYGNR